MDLKAILTAQGLSEEQVTAVMAGMKEHKIYTASQENLDVRYEKLKAKHEELTTTHATATAELEGLKTASTGSQELQAELAKAKADYEALQQESTKKVKMTAIDYALKEQMKAHKAKDKYADLLSGKIDREALQLDEKGAVVGLEDIFTSLKTEYSDLFEAAQPVLSGTPPAGAASTGGSSALAEQIRQSINQK